MLCLNLPWQTMPASSYCPQLSLPSKISWQSDSLGSFPTQIAVLMDSGLVPSENSLSTRAIAPLQSCQMIKLHLERNTMFKKGLTIWREVQLTTDNRSILVIPSIVTNCAISSSNAHFNSTNSQMSINNVFIRLKVDTVVIAARADSHISFSTKCYGDMEIQPHVK